MSTTEETISIDVEKRETKGTAEARRSRKEGVVPGVVYGEGKLAVQIQLNEHDFKQTLSHFASENLLVELKIDGKAEGKVLIKEVQHHPLKDEILHVDFQKVNLKQAILFEIPLETVGESKGVSLGGTLEQHVRVIEVKCLPTEVDDFIEVDISDLEMGEHLYIRDIKVDDKYEIVTNGDIMFASVHVPRTARKAAEGEEANTEDEEETEAQE